MALPANIRLDFQDFPGTNTPANQLECFVPRKT
jgi:hypothetical protein